jgi:hypothetical protein
MGGHDEHDDDLEPEVIEGEEIETEKYEQAEDEDELVPGLDVTTLPDRARRKPPNAGPDESDDEAADTI